MRDIGISSYGNAISRSHQGDAEGLAVSQRKRSAGVFCVCATNSGSSAGQERWAFSLGLAKPALQLPAPRDEATRRLAELKKTGADGRDPQVTDT
jgi:hypothetical protein